jgi:hypothetical protein
MNYLRSFLEEKKRAEKPIPPTDKTDKSTIGSFGSGSSALSSTAFCRPSVLPPILSSKRAVATALRLPSTKTAA